MIHRFLLLFLLNQNHSYTQNTQFFLCCWENTRNLIQLQWTVIYFGFVSECVSGQGGKRNLWKGGKIIPCPGSSAQHTDAHVSKIAGGSFLCIFAGALLLTLFDVVFLTALLPPSPAWPCWCNSQPEHRFNQARLGRPCWGWCISTGQLSSQIPSQFSQDHHFHRQARPSCHPASESRSENLPALCLSQFCHK